jgi:hypothetical protein
MKKVKMVVIVEVLLTEKDYKKLLVNLEDSVQRHANKIADKKTQSFVSITLDDGTKIEKVGKKDV